MKWKMIFVAITMLISGTFSVFAIEPNEVAILTASDGAAIDGFGESVALDGNTIVIGSFLDDENDYDSGSAYVFEWDGIDWIEQKLTASDGVKYDWFGDSVAFDGDTIVVGAPGINGSYPGSAYVFRWDGMAWFEQAQLMASDGAPREEFGQKVAVDGDIIVVAIDRDVDYFGAVYVFRWTGDAWIEQTKLTASDGAAFDMFGNSVALDGNTIVIGSARDDENGTKSGAAYVFSWDGTAWFEQAKLMASDGTYHDHFGRSVAVDGNTIVVGANEHGIPGSGPGSAYVFKWNGTVWVEQAKLVASDGAVDDRFGHSVAVEGGTAVVGAWSDDDLGDYSGSAYVFIWDGTNWNEQPKLNASDGTANDWFGLSIDMDGGTVVIGAHGNDDLGNNSGSAYVFSLLSNETPQGEDIIVYPPPVDEYGDPIEDSPAISLTFEDLEEGGETTVVVNEPGDGTPSTPSGFRITGIPGGPVIFNIETTATLAPGSQFEVCFGYSDMINAGNPENLALAHEVDGEWVDITTTNDTVNLIICGISDSFSYFTILELVEISGPADPIALGAEGAEGAEAFLSINVGDSTLADTVRWQWGDGTSDDISVMANEVTTGHIYIEAGVYTATATLMLSGFEIVSTEFRFVVVYDPSAGFVTGGGWFISPEGAFLANLRLTGMSSFGFVSKYKRGAQLPTGRTEFQFKTAGLNFKSSEYQWLVIAGARAQFRGYGTINGIGNYGFMLTAIDENLTPSTDTDLFRIKIWNTDADDAVVYDNSLGESDGAEPSTAIEGGSIVIHKAKK